MQTTEERMRWEGRTMFLSQLVDGRVFGKWIGELLNNQCHLLPSFLHKILKEGEDYQILNIFLPRANRGWQSRLARPALVCPVLGPQKCGLGWFALRSYCGLEFLTRPA